MEKRRALPRRRRKIWWPSAWTQVRMSSGCFPLHRTEPTPRYHVGIEGGSPAQALGDVLTPADPQLALAGVLLALQDATAEPALNRRLVDPQQIGHLGRRQVARACLPHQGAGGEAGGNLVGAAEIHHPLRGPRFPFHGVRPRGVEHRRDLGVSEGVGLAPEPGGRCAPG
jgi:hypothetical protein